ncbi:glutamine-hydrolyzing carbamoyl-phosphate synthase small subunit [Sediminicurvatus halobius]|uniref:Carbamoyl phosphate synthase small chain n=1 Tax=Sediminicurvatus halobius TaxID=2182432 RepID=A0A2U2N4Q9_9GAMM|nr:glutamine-hydrolyzing carbamoyl-phosphate synthase small subunit [Spiribacter halobius]PWG64072.1 carbamoyl-phosphate synthase small subunit [Spiribacter halobius]UEX76873.1 glutamine-hydrolyzing carbamoyl-phosphate synthase small subunit [Spiribacter halobius]
MAKAAILALADGTVFHGRALGAEGQTVGEVCFNTAMTGYQEICTDPSYHGQLVTLTYPHIGNTGANPLDEESLGPQLAGLIVRDAPVRLSSWRARESLPDYLERNGVVAISDIDTRRLTRIIREGGAQNGCILAGEPDADAAVAAARECPDLKGRDLVQAVTTAEAYEWRLGTWALERGEREPEPRPEAELPWHVVAYDFGIKRNILRQLVDHGCRVTVVPAQTPAAEVLAMRPHGVFLSNGPGDPEPLGYAIEATREILASGTPVFGICLGHQLLGLAVGGRTVKMKFGHHGANHPVLDEDAGRVMISSQNHGFAVDAESLPANVRVLQRSLFDGSLQGIHLTDQPAFSFQGHPEASPGPHDVAPLFGHFIELMDGRRGDAA